MTTNESHSFLLKSFKSAAAKVQSVLNTNYLQSIVGRTHAFYLLTYILGLIIGESHQNAAAISSQLKMCYHDSIARMLWNMRFPFKVLSRLFISFIERHRQRKGWLIIDDTSIAKKFASKIGYAGYAWCSSLGKVAQGIHIVTLFWTDGRWRFPVGFLLWRPREKSKNYRTKVELARRLVVENIDFCRGCDYLVFDSWYCSKGFLQTIKTLGISCVSTLVRNRNVIFKGRKMRISDFGLGFCGEMELPGFGKVKVFATTIGQRKHYLASTDTSIGPDELLVRYKGRWPIEEHFRVLKQSLGLKACQCRKDAAVVNHVTAVYLAYCVLEVLANNEKHTHGQAKRIMQEEFFQHEQKLPSLKHRKHVIKLEA